MNYEQIPVEGGVPIKAWVKGVPFEDAAREQVMNVARLSCVGPHIAVMPDVHAGKGSTVGCVIPTVNAAIPAAVGVDIGCGMLAAMTNISLADLGKDRNEGAYKERLHRLRLEIEKRVPHGRSDNGGFGDVGAWSDGVPAGVAHDWVTWLAQRYEDICEKNPQIRHHRAQGQLGTLGTGNHFIEICVDTDENVWIMLHSGSRGPGNKIGTYFTKVAQALMKDVQLPDRDLAYLIAPQPEFYEYIEAVRWAQDYAELNRKIMFQAVRGAVATVVEAVPEIEKFVNCHHNYIAEERHDGRDLWITRKGAVNASAGRMGIIPGSMGARSFIVRGLGNKDSFTSCSHGAGRVVSRNEAKRRFTIEDHVAAVAGVECRTDVDVIDETPMAYKDIDAVIAAQSDLVEVVHELKQILCVKG